ncbi:TlpA disulfide reductase family protein [Clostridiaceae bacterium M8S5]|nr:TlpA disulfide reductase family protein [Clostridiaceae bacterium M8S5]
MKKIIVILVTALLILSLIGCTGDTNKEQTGKEANNTNKEQDVNDKKDSDKEEQKDKAKNPIAGITIPDFKTTDLDGKEITNEIFKDSKITMINVWGTFCPPCIEEMPDLQKLYDYSQKKDINIIGIVADVKKDENTDKAKEIVKEAGVKYTNILVEEVLMNKVLKDFQYVPTSIFVDAKGKVLDTFKVGSATYEEYKVIIDKLAESIK